MSRTQHPGSRFPNIRRIWKPVAVTGAGGTAVAFWLEEIVMFAQEILALIFLPLLAGAVYLLDHFIFKSRIPKREDLDSPQDKGAK